MANNNKPNYTLFNIIVAAIVIFYAWCSFNSPSSKEQYEHDFYQENGMTVDRAEYLESESADDDYQYNRD